MSISTELNETVKYCKERGAKIASLASASADDKIGVLRNWIADRRKHLTSSAIDQYDCLRNLTKDGVDLATLQAMDKYSTVLEDGRIIQYEFDNLTDPTNLRVWIGETYSDVAIVRQAGEAMVYATVTEQGSELLNKLDDVLGEVNDDAAEYLDYAESLLASAKTSFDDTTPLITAGLQSVNATVRELASIAASTPGDMRANAVVSYMLDGWSKISDNIKTRMTTTDDDAGEFDPAQYQDFKTVVGLAGAWSLLSQAASSIGSILLCIGGPLVKGVGAVVVGAGYLMNLLFQKATSQEYMSVNEKLPNYLFANALRFVLPTPSTNVLPLSLIEGKTRLSLHNGTLMYNPEANWYKDKYNIPSVRFSGLWYPNAIARYIQDSQDITKLFPSKPVLRHGLVWRGASSPASHTDAIETLRATSFHEPGYFAQQHTAELFASDADTVSMITTGGSLTQFDMYINDDGVVDNDAVELCTRAEIFRSILSKCFDSAWLSMQNYVVGSMGATTPTIDRLRLLGPFSPLSNVNNYATGSLKALGHALICGSLNANSGVNQYFITRAIKVEKAITVMESLDFTNKVLQFIEFDLPRYLASNGLYPVNPSCLTVAHVPSWVEINHLLLKDMVFEHYSMSHDEHDVPYSSKPIWEEICDKYDFYQMGTGQEDLNGFKAFLSQYCLFELVLILITLGASSMYNQSYEIYNHVTLSNIRAVGVVPDALSQGWMQVSSANIGSDRIMSYPYRDPFSSVSDIPTVVDNPAITPPRFARGTLLSIVIVAAGVILAATIAAIAIKRAFRNHQRAKLVEREDAADKAQKRLASMSKDDPGYKEAVTDYVKSQRRFQRYAGRIGYSSNSIGSYSSTGSIPVPDMSSKISEVVESAYSSGADYLAGLYGDATPAVTIDDLDLSEVTDSIAAQSGKITDLNNDLGDFQINMNTRLGEMQSDVTNIRNKTTIVKETVDTIHGVDIPLLERETRTAQNLATSAASASYKAIRYITGNYPKSDD